MKTFATFLHLPTEVDLI